jgi:hypothetical protein
VVEVIDKMKSIERRIAGKECRRCRRATAIRLCAATIVVVEGQNSRLKRDAANEEEKAIFDTTSGRVVVVLSVWLVASLL